MFLLFGLGWVGFTVFHCISLYLVNLRLDFFGLPRDWNVGDEDGILRRRQNHGVVGKPKQVGERQHVDQAPHLFDEVMQAVKCIFHKGRIRTELLRQFGTHFRVALRHRLKGHGSIKHPRVKHPQCRIDLRVTVAHAEQKLCRMTLLRIHFVRLGWHLSFNVGVSVVKCVLVVPASDAIRHIQGCDCARKLAHVDVGQHASDVGIGRVQSSQEGSLVANMVTHVGGDALRNESVVGSGVGTKVGKHVVLVVVLLGYTDTH